MTLVSLELDCLPFSQKFTLHKIKYKFADNKDGLTAASGEIFTRDRKGIVRVLTISLAALALFSGGLLAYQQLSKPSIPKLISKAEAIQIALKSGDWDEQTLRSKEIEATLVHVKANGFSFIVNQRTFEDTTTLYQNQYPSYEDQYLWIVSISAPIYGDWVYTIDARTGQIATLP